MNALLPPRTALLIVQPYRGSISPMSIGPFRALGCLGEDAMTYLGRATTVQRILRKYLTSPSLRHIRDQRSMELVSMEIVEALDGQNGVWQKWNGVRGDFMEAALECWIPEDDFLAFLNSLPGPPLTMTDLVQRKRAMEEDEYKGRPEPELRDACRAIYSEELASGTELAAIVGRINAFLGEEIPRLWERQREAEQAKRDAARLERERRLLSPADCPWTQMKGSACVYCRKNGQLFRLTPNKDKTLDMHRVDAVDDKARGELIGRYRTRTDANKVLAKLVYEN